MRERFFAETTNSTPTNQPFIMSRLNRDRDRDRSEREELIDQRQSSIMSVGSSNHQVGTVVKVWGNNSKRSVQNDALV